jgi:hypothetical protein
LLIQTAAWLAPESPDLGFFWEPCEEVGSLTDEDVEAAYTIVT